MHKDKNPRRLNEESVRTNRLRANEVGPWRSIVYLGVRVICLIYIKVRCSQRRRLRGSLESRDRVRLHPMHYASQWNGPTDKDSYINRNTQPGLLVRQQGFFGLRALTHNVQRWRWIRVVSILFCGRFFQLFYACDFLFLCLSDTNVILRCFTS